MSMRNGKSARNIHIFSTRHETWTLSQNNSIVTLKKKKRQRSNIAKNIAKLQYYLSTTIFGSNWTKGFIQQYLVQLTSSRPQLEIQVPSPLHPSCSRGICLMTISSSWPTDIWNAFTSTKANSEIFSNHIVKKYFNIILTRHTFYWDTVFSLMLHFFYKYPILQYKKMLYHTEIWTFSPLIFFRIAFLSLYLGIKML